MIVTLTIRMAEDLSSFLKHRNIKVVYMHNETKTLERTEIIYQLRRENMTSWWASTCFGRVSIFRKYP
jgi:excinuclease UvrABC helicase subunit UvrB